MATIVIYPYLSPRIIEVLAPDTSISIQELVDLVRDWEDEDDNMSFDSIISAAGKEDLGSGVTVGITATLNNAQIMFTGRTTPLDDGAGRTCDATDADGLQLYVDDADFITDGVAAGDTVYNATTGSMAVITEVVDQYTLNHLTLSGGATTTWTNGDSYVVYENVQCSIDGGNLVALDSTNTSISSTLPSPNVQIVRTSSSSATLQELGAVQYSSFNGGITIDIDNITGKAVSGTAFPIGTPEAPCDNIDDAFTIADSRGFPTFYVIGDLDITAALPDLENFNFIGESQTKSAITIADAANVYRCEFQDATISGTLDGESSINQCIIETLVYVNGTIYNSLINGGIELGGGSVAHIINCASGVPGTATPYVDMGGSGQSLGVRNYNGGLELRNKTGADSVSIDLNSGQIILDSTVTDGDIVIRGIGKLTDNSTGTTNVIADDLLNKENITKANWDKVWLDIDHGVPGTAFPIGTIETPSNNFTDALTILNGLGTEKMHIHGNITLDQDLSDITIEGHGYSSAVITLNSKLLSGVKFEKLTITGTAATGGQFSGNECRLNSVTNVRGSWDNCVFYGNFVIDSGQTWNGDKSSFPEANSVINMNGTSNFGMANVSGGFALINSTNVANTIGITGIYLLTLDASCTAGTALTAGIGIMTNNSTMSTIDRTLPQATINNLETLFFNNQMNEVIYESTGTAGTAFPIGTLQFPCNNITDSMAIAAANNIGKILFKDSATISTGVDVSDFVLKSDDFNSVITVEDAAICNNTVFSYANVTGILDGGSRIENSIAEDITFLNGSIKNTLLKGAMVLGGGVDSILTNCYTEGIVVIDMGGEGQSLTVSNFNGMIQLTNKTGTDDVHITINSGEIMFTATVTDGTIYCKGVGRITQDLSKGAQIFDALNDMSDIIKPPGGILRVNQID